MRSRNSLREELKERVDNYLSEFVKTIKRRFEFIDSIYLIGSFSRGDFAAWSDADILILTNSLLNKKEEWRVKEDILSLWKLNIPCDIMIYFKGFVKGSFIEKILNSEAKPLF